MLYQETIDFIKKEHGMFDIIIDDGSHAWHHQEFFFKNYDQLLSDKGMMYYEDIHVSTVNNLMSLKDQLKLYILDLSQNTPVLDDNNIVVLKYKEEAV